MGALSADQTEVLIAAAEGLGPPIRAVREQIDRERQLPPSLVEAMVEAGLFTLFVPRELGGAEADPLTAVRVIETVARFDGAAGWCAMIGAGTGVASGYLPAAGAREIFADPAAITGGFFGVGGRAVPVDGGYRVSGRWGFNSGSPHCTWLVGGCVVYDGDAPRPGPTGAPVIRHAFFPDAEYTLLNTWHTGGLRGTGSNDFTVADAFVPDRRILAFGDPPTQPGPLYRFPLFALLAPVLAAASLGIARGAIDALHELAVTKPLAGGRELLRDQVLIQDQVARAEAQLGSARAYLLETLEAAWDDVCAGRELPLAQRSRIRLASVHASDSATRAVDLMYAAGGASAIYESNPLERAFRDIHTATQHAYNQGDNYARVGRVLLGLDLGPGMPF